MPLNVHYILHIEHCTLLMAYLYCILQSYHFTLTTFKICLFWTQHLNSNMYLETYMRQCEIKVIKLCQVRIKLIALGWYWVTMMMIMIMMMIMMMMMMALNLHWLIYLAQHLILQIYTLFFQLFVHEKLLRLCIMSLTSCQVYLCNVRFHTAQVWPGANTTLLVSC